MELIQIKAFNKETVTDEIAYKIFAIAGKWSTYLRPEYVAKGMKVEERWYGKTKGGSNHQDAWNNPNFKLEGYTRTFQGLKLTPLNSTSHVFYLDVDGAITCYNEHNKGDLKSWSLESGEERYEKFEMNLEYPAHQIKLVQLYIDLGFYTIQI